jgi:xylan 1,4-beta-xylosidase
MRCCLRIKKFQERRFYASEDNQSWNLVGSDPNCTFLSDEGITQGKHHTGTLVGLFANNGGSGSRVPADFDWFRYRNE